MLIGKLRWLALAFCLLCAAAHAQEANLETGRPVERQIAGGQRARTLLDQLAEARLDLRKGVLPARIERAQAAIRKASPHYASLAAPSPLKHERLKTAATGTGKKQQAQPLAFNAACACGGPGERR